MAYSGVPLNTEQTLDLWKTTLSSYEWEQKEMDYLFPLHHFVVVDQWFGKDKREVEPGTQIKREVIYREDGNVAYVNPGEVRTRSMLDVVTEVTIPWCGVAGNHSILKATIRRNTGRAKLKDEAKKKRATCMMAMAVSLEGKAWGIPDTSDNKYPYGIPYYLVPITGAQVTAGTGAGAHQGGANPAFTYVAGINPATYTRWQSYNATWSNSSGDITEADLLRMGKMHRRLRFRAPSIVDDIKLPKFQQQRYYTDETIIDAYAAAMRRGRDDLGPDPSRGYGAGLDSAGEPIFKRQPLIWIEELDTADTTNRGANPFYMINHDYFYPVIEAGCYFDEDAPMRSVDQPDLFTTHVDLNFNLVCSNRQLVGGMISYVAAA